MTFTTLTQKLAIATGAIAAASFVAAAPAQALVLGQYNFDLAGAGGTLAPSTTAAGVTLSNFAYSGTATPTYFSGNPDDAYAATGWTTSTNYFSFLLTPGSNPVSLTSIAFDAQSSGSGPSIVRLTSSLDNYVSAIDGSSGNGSFASNTLNLGSTFANLTAPVTFRLSGVGPSASGGALGSGGTLRVDNVTVNGDFVTPVPTPALLPALLGFGASIVRKRKQETV
jgi:hypothetical protein